MFQLSVLLTPSSDVPVAMALSSLPLPSPYRQGMQAAPKVCYDESGEKVLTCHDTQLAATNHQPPSTRTAHGAPSSNGAAQGATGEPTESVEDTSDDGGNQQGTPRSTTLLPLLLHTASLS